LIVKFKKTHPSAVVPTKNSNGDAAYDLYSVDRAIIGPMNRACVSVGLSIEIPEGYYGRIAPRSGLAVKQGVDVLAGVIDSSYRGELGVVLINLNFPSEILNPEHLKGGVHSYESLFGSRQTVDLAAGSRIAQLIIERCYNVEWEEVDDLSDSVRQEGGFGSSGI
jgi:dUTP pyrophosphatase